MRYWKEKTYKRDQKMLGIYWKNEKQADIFDDRCRFINDSS